MESGAQTCGGTPQTVTIDRPGDKCTPALPRIRCEIAGSPLHCNNAAPYCNSALSQAIGNDSYETESVIPASIQALQ